LRHRELAADAERPALQKLNRWYVPDNVKTRYQQLHVAWQEMDARIARGDSAWYQRNIEDFVGRIDAFVLALSTTPNIKFRR
jgi:two-component system nitrate/nitrite sensor histidine kinase NarQ